MSTSKKLDRICLAALAFAFAIAALALLASALGFSAGADSGLVLGYETRLFDTLAIRAKGNTSLSSVAAYGNDRCSFKIEFDHYDSSLSYYGLDKLNLNNLIQDNTCMKDFLCCQLMALAGAPAPLCSYVWITVNGEDWGLYLAVEGVEESFLLRNYGTDYGELYKPDSTEMGAGRGNGGGFDMDEFRERFSEAEAGAETNAAAPEPSGEVPMRPEGGGEFDMPENGGEFAMPGIVESGGMQQPGGGFDMQQPGGGGGGMMGADDVYLVYTDDDYDSYANIFDNAKTDVTDADKDRLIAALRQLGEGGDVSGCVDIESVIRYFVAHNFVCNFDSYTGSMVHNYYLYEDDGVLSMIPWDYNLAFGGFMSGSDAASLVNYSIDEPVSGASVESRPMLAWIFASEEYTELYHELFAQFIDTVFTSGLFEQLMQETAALISPYVERDPTSFCSYEDFELGVQALTEFCLLRAESISSQLSGEDRTADASALDLDAMGGMDNAAGRSPGQDRGPSFRPEAG